MLRRVILSVVFCGLAAMSLPGCVFSLGGKTEHVTTCEPEMINRLSGLEARVTALEQQTGSATLAAPSQPPLLPSP
ncbi:MAG: hypothetical protein ACKV0T_07010 [Planctomycetales bacterium]